MTSTEDLDLDARITVELVPRSSWYSNVRSNVSREQWDRIRKSVYKEHDWTCELCGAKGRVECHEMWHYDDVQHIQTLVRMMCLCSACHEVKHIGLAQVRGRGDIALVHLAKVNGWTWERAERYVREKFSVWSRRSQHEWKLNLEALQGYLQDAP